MPKAATDGPGSASAFLGRWELARTIKHADGLEGQYEGAVTVTAAGPDRFTYAEEGWMRLGDGAPLWATRSYLWKAKGNGVNVYFDDGRPFHRIDLSGPRTATTHECDPDFYAVEYDFSRWPVWTSRWRANGPRKAYEMVTTFQRGG